MVFFKKKKQDRKRKEKDGEKKIQNQIKSYNTINRKLSMFRKGRRRSKKEKSKILKKDQ